MLGVYLKMSVLFNDIVYMVGLFKLISLLLWFNYSKGYYISNIIVAT